MNLITDTYIGKEHFRDVLSEPGFVAFQCKPEELQSMHLNLQEWVRQLEAEMVSRDFQVIK